MGYQEGSYFPKCTQATLHEEKVDPHPQYLRGESGIWTPTVRFGDEVQDLSIAYGAQVGYFQRVGRVMDAWCYLEGTPTFDTATGNYHVCGLPYIQQTTYDGEEFAWRYYPPAGGGVNFSAGMTLAGANVLLPMAEDGANIIGGWIDTQWFDVDYPTADGKTLKLTHANFTSGVLVKMYAQLRVFLELDADGAPLAVADYV